jgi:glycosyltransferase involved in cell wall biosynthesis
MALTTKTVSVILPTFREKGSIRTVIADFFRTGVVQEIIVVNNNAEKGTSEHVADTGAIEIEEHRQGYGFALGAGMEACTGDYIFWCEPDGTFIPRDIHKLLAYLDDFDMVLGTRTSPVLIWNGANMRGLLRWGNWAVAKLVEFLYNTPNLTDVGCTFRGFRRSVYEKVKCQSLSGGSDFGLQFTLRAIRSGIRFIEIPLNYCPRVGFSSVTGHLSRAVVLGVRMCRSVILFRLQKQ